MIHLKKSNHLVIVQRASDWAVYHALFGDLLLVDRQGLDLLNAFSKPLEVGQAHRRFSHIDESDF